MSYAPVVVVLLLMAVGGWQCRLHAAASLPQTSRLLMALPGVPGHASSLVADGESSYTSSYPPVLVHARTAARTPALALPGPDRGLRPCQPVSRE